VNKTIVIEEIEKLTCRKKNTGDNYVITCPWHFEKKPSCSINIENVRIPVGTYHCFGCGKSGSWNELAKKLNLRKIDSSSKKDPDIVIIHIKKLLEEVVEGSLPTNKAILGKWDSNWRNYNYDFLKQFSPYSHFDEYTGKKRILFPIKIFDEMIGYSIIGKEGDHFHQHSKGKWIRKALFPYDNHKSNAVVLVEGITDALHLLKHKIPSLCFFGVENWGKYKTNLLAAKNIEIVAIVCDGDDPGYSCNRKLWNELKNKFDVRMFDLPRKDKKMDPGNAPKKIINVIRSIIQ